MRGVVLGALSERPRRIRADARCGRLRPRTGLKSALLLHDGEAGVYEAPEDTLRVRPRRSSAVAPYAHPLFDSKRRSRADARVSTRAERSTNPPPKRGRAQQARVRGPVEDGPDHLAALWPTLCECRVPHVCPGSLSISHPAAVLLKKTGPVRKFPTLTVTVALVPVIDTAMTLVSATEAMSTRRKNPRLRGTRGPGRNVRVPARRIPPPQPFWFGRFGSRAGKVRSHCLGRKRRSSGAPPS